MQETTRWRQKLYEDQQHLHKDRINKQKAFAAANQELIKHREQCKQEARNFAKLERLNYFPFTHGDSIEKNKKILTELQQQDIVKAIM